LPEEYWIDGIPHERATPEERAARIEAEKQAKKDKNKRVPGEIPKYIKGRKEGMDLEKRIAKQWNGSMSAKKPKKQPNVKMRPSFDDDLEPEEEEVSGIQVSKSFSTKSPTLFRETKVVEQEAKRQPNSGAMWFAKGDITFDHALMEVKERGSKNARGEKSISIPKEWLTKQADEAFQERRDYWYLAFAYKNDDGVYLIKPYDHEIEMVKELRRLAQENEELKKQLEGK